MKKEEKKNSSDTNTAEAFDNLLDFICPRPYLLGRYEQYGIY